MTHHVFLTHFAFATLIAAFSAAVTAVLARHLRILDVPNQRSSHATPTPRGGGLAILAAFMLGLLIIHLIGDTVPIRSRYFWGFMVALLLIVTVSFFDDVKDRSLLLKLGTQLLAIAIVISTGIFIDEMRLPWAGLIMKQWWFYPLTALWILGLTNAYNFMDGLDGMAASTAVVVSIFFSAIAFQQGSHFIYLASLVLCAASLGFLLFNWSPAKIFMGDVGSTFLGFTFAVMAIIAARYDLSHTSLFVLPLLLFHFIFDTAFTFLRRLAKGQHVLQAHRTHLYQLLNQLGYSHRAVSSLYAAMAFMQGLAAIWMVNNLGESRPLMYFPFLILHGIYAIWVVSAAKKRGLL